MALPFILPFLSFLRHIFYRAACGAIRANIVDHPDSNCAPIILQEQCLPDIKLFICLYKSATKTTWGEVGWFTGACNAVDFILIAPDPHVRHTGQYRTDGIFVSIYHHRLLWRTYFANIITGNGIGVCRMLNIQEALSTNKFFGEAGLIGIKRQGKKVRKIPTLDS